MKRVWETDRGVALRDEDYLGDEIIRHFWVPPGDGVHYVWEEFPHRSGTLGKQVCYGLSHYGSTLMSTSDGLAALIRREYRRAKRSEKNG